VPDCNYTVNVTPEADERMFDHICFLAQKSVLGAKSLYSKLRKEIDSLDYDPMMYPVYFTQKPTAKDIAFRHKFCAKRHRIVFEVVDDIVYIQDVQDCRQHQNKSFL